MNENEIEWRPGINAPKNYPICTFLGKLSVGEDINLNVCGIATGVVQNGGWGNSGLEMTTGNFIPQMLKIGWFSFAENTYYKGEFELPKNKIANLFQQGFTGSNGRFEGYDTFITNLYPKGGVAVWMSISGIRTVEIGHFQADETNYEWERMYPNMELGKDSYVAKVMNGIEGGQAYFALHDISQEPFKSIYRNRQNYVIVIEAVTPSNIIQVVANFYNGEMDTIWGQELANNFFKTKAVPKHIFFRWQQNGITYFGEVYFKEEEIFKVFHEMNKACPDESYQLLLKPDFITKKVLVALVSKNKEIGFKKYGKMGKSSIQ